MWAISSIIASVVILIILGWLAMAIFFGIKAMWRHSKQMVMTLLACIVIVSIIWFAIKSALGR
jgi:biotin transporter BioY